MAHKNQKAAAIKWATDNHPCYMFILFSSVHVCRSMVCVCVCVSLMRLFA